MSRQQATSQLSAVLEKARAAGYSQSELKNALSDELTSSKTNRTLKPAKRTRLSVHYLIFRLLPVLFAMAVFYIPASNLLTGSPCVLSQLTPLGEVIHPLVSCEVCRGVTAAPRLVNLSREHFVHQHAYQSKPVLAVGAAADWPALEVFSYDYFKELYLQTPAALDEEGAQFFSYSSNIANLRELFELPSDIAAVSKERWYIGWSTTDSSIGEELQKHVSTPSFLPPRLSSFSVAWIFMGTPGPGASIHIDRLDLPSWQAQLSGTKTWTLTPPAECEHVCQPFNVTVHRGDIIVIDTNKWYHQTYIHPGSISITIGSEYE